MPYHGIDEDCDGWSDYDADGWESEASSGEDCDDADETIHPESALTPTTATPPGFPLDHAHSIS